MTPAPYTCRLLIAAGTTPSTSAVTFLADTPALAAGIAATYAAACGAYDVTLTDAAGCRVPLAGRPYWTGVPA